MGFVSGSNSVLFHPEPRRDRKDNPWTTQHGNAMEMMDHIDIDSSLLNWIENVSMGGSTGRCTVEHMQWLPHERLLMNEQDREQISAIVRNHRLQDHSFAENAGLLFPAAQAKEPGRRTMPSKHYGSDSALALAAFGIVR